MSFLSGPSKYVTTRMAEGVAAAALQLRMLVLLDDDARAEILKGMKREGAPTSIDELVAAAGSVIAQQRMGWWKRNQYLATIQSRLISSGFSQSEAMHLSGLIELASNTPLPSNASTLANIDMSPSTPIVAPYNTPFTPSPIDEEPESTGLEPDAITEAEGFFVGEKVVYPAHGVGEIQAIEYQEIAGAKLELFVINFIKDKMTLRVPTRKILNVGMRKLSDPSTISRALVYLSDQPTGRWRHNFRPLEIEEKINSGDTFAIAEVVRELHPTALGYEPSYSERQLYDAALDRLAREIAAVRKIIELEAVREIEAHARQR
jgi:CarD family transcriptional regulator